MEDLCHLANNFAYRELCADILGSPLDLSDLESCLVLKPWLDEERHQAYHQLIDLNLVPRVKPFWYTLESREALIEAGSDVRLLGFKSLSLFPVAYEHPELLMSQQVAFRRERYG